MRMLVIGIDGASLATFSRGWTPYIEGLLSRGDDLGVEEDLVARGWFKVATGNDGITTGALYDHPKLGATTNWTLSFGMADAPGFGDSIVPLWKAISDAGYRVGVMNLPTMFPAPPVNGFFVCGGGGGAPVVREPTQSHCYPPEIFPDLKEAGYIVDERQNTLIGESGLRSARDVLDRLAHKNSRRASSFSDLSRRFAIDFGFIVFKSSSVFAEAICLPELEAAARQKRAPCLETMDALERYYRAFDDEIRGLVEACGAEELIFVSDHGSLVPHWRFNPNVWLQQNGYQRPSAGRRIARQMITNLKGLVPYSLRRAIKKQDLIKRGWNEVSLAPGRESIAFSALIGSWRNGIYVNDDSRFGGAVSSDDVPKVAAELVQALNSDSNLLKQGVSAKLASLSHSVSPDVLLDMPDTMITSPTKTKLFEPFDLPKSPLGLRPLVEGKQLCMKSKMALSVNVTHEWKRSSMQKPYDLTDVYSYIVGRFPAV